jgi:hypothetical protein
MPGIDRRFCENHGDAGGCSLPVRKRGLGLGIGLSHDEMFVSQFSVAITRAPELDARNLSDVV